MADTNVDTGIGSMGRSMEGAAESMDRPVDSVVEKIPSSPYFLGTLGSIVLSAGLYAAGKKSAALFVGLWAPTVLNMGMYNKLLRISRGFAH